MPTDIIQWFPGHMAKTRRLMKENLKNVDVVIELLDARIPHSSRNPEIEKLTEGKPLVTLLNKSALADPDATERWMAHYKKKGGICLAIDCVSGKGLEKLMPAIRSLLADKLDIKVKRSEMNAQAQIFADMLTENDQSGQKYTSKDAYEQYGDILIECSATYNKVMKIVMEDTTFTQS